MLPSQGRMPVISSPSIHLNWLMKSLDHLWISVMFHVSLFQISSCFNRFFCPLETKPRPWHPDRNRQLNYHYEITAEFHNPQLWDLSHVRRDSWSTTTSTRTPTSPRTTWFTVQNLISLSVTLDGPASPGLWSISIFPPSTPNLLVRGSLWGFYFVIWRKFSR